MEFICSIFSISSSRYPPASAGALERPNVLANDVGLIDDGIDQMKDNIGNTNQNTQIMRSQTNAHLPISRLPVEVILEIFMLLVGIKDIDSLLSYDDPRPWWDWLILTKICQRWRSIALGSPCLWREIDNFSRVDKIQAYLDRSGRAELVIIYGDEKKKTFIPAHIIDLFKGHMHRVQKFIIISNSATDAAKWGSLWTLLSSPLPCLKVLFLQASDGISVPIPMTVLDHTMHSKEVWIKNMAFPWNNFILRNLSVLNLTYNHIHEEKELQELLDILETCPNLRHLNLEGVQIHSSQPIPNRLIELFQLEHMVLPSMEFKVCNRFFECINAPKCVDWEIHCLDYPFYRPRPFIHKLLESGHRYEDVTVDVTEEMLHIEGEPHIEDKYTYVPVASLALDWVSNINPSEATHSLFTCIKTILKRPLWSNMTRLVFDLDLEEDESMVSVKKADWSQFFTVTSEVRYLCVKFPTIWRTQIPDCVEIGFMEAIIEPKSIDEPDSIQCYGVEVLRLVRAEFSTAEGQKAYKIFVDYLCRRVQHGRRLRTLELFECVGANQEEIENLDVAENYSFCGDEWEW